MHLLFTNVKFSPVTPLSFSVELQRPEAGVFWEAAFGSLYLKRCAQKGRFSPLHISYLLEWFSLSLCFNQLQTLYGRKYVDNSVQLSRLELGSIVSEKVLDNCSYFVARVLRTPENEVYKKQFSQFCWSNLTGLHKVLTSNPWHMQIQWQAPVMI